MPFPETFQPRIVFAHGNETGGDSSGSISKAQNPLENPSPNSSFPIEHIQTEEVQQTLQAVGLVAQSLNRRGKRIDLPTDEIAAEYLNGADVTEMAQGYRVSTRTIYRRLHESGLPTHAQKINTSTLETNRSTKRQFWWWRDLSENAQKLYLLLDGGGGDRDILPIVATKQGFDLEAALDEIRKYGKLDENDSDIIRLTRGKQ